MQKNKLLKIIVLLGNLLHAKLYTTATAKVLKDQLVTLAINKVHSFDIFAVSSGYLLRTLAFGLMFVNTTVL